MSDEGYGSLGAGGGFGLGSLGSGSSSGGSSSPMSWSNPTVPGSKKKKTLQEMYQELIGTDPASLITPVKPLHNPSTIYDQSTETGEFFRPGAYNLRPSIASQNAETGGTDYTPQGPFMPKSYTPGMLGEPYYDSSMPHSDEVTKSKTALSRRGIDPAFAKAYWEDNPLGAYYGMFPQAAEDSPFGNWLRNNYNKYFAKYQTQLPLSPNLTFWDYLDTQNPQKDFTESPFSARSMRGFLTRPKVRYVGF